MLARWVHGLNGAVFLLPAQDEGRSFARRKKLGTVEVDQGEGAGWPHESSP